MALALYPSYEVALDKVEREIESKVYSPNDKNHIKYKEIKDNKKTLYKSIK